MTQNLLPEIFDRPFRSVPNPWKNWFMNPWENLFDEDLISRELSANGIPIKFGKK